MANYAVTTQGAPALRYLFKVSNPATHDSMDIAADTPRKALSVFGNWFAVPTTDVAISRRVPVQEVLS